MICNVESVAVKASVLRVASVNLSANGHLIVKAIVWIVKMAAVSICLAILMMIVLP
jgi:hypothetical protein